MFKKDKAKKSKYRGGFTTVELMVVIVLIMILASGLVFGIMKWVEWTNFKQQNEYARTIFVAAQNQLTEYSDSGLLEEKTASIRQKKGIMVSDLLDGEGVAYSLDEVWPESADKANPEIYRDKVSSITATSEDYQAYAAGTLDQSSDAYLLYDMLSSYLYDMSILNATVCIEFTPNEAQVFAVLYSNRATGFEYNPDNKNTKGTVDISNRESGYRKARMVGYYGVDTLYKATTTKAEKPSISGVRLNNEETLNLTYTLSKVKPALQELTYEITIYDKESQQALMKMFLDGTKIKSYADLKSTDNNAWVSCEVIRYNYDNNGDSTEESMGNYNILAWLNTDNIITVVFDAADTAANSTLYYEAYPELLPGKFTDSINSPMSILKSTNSFRRFGIQASNIYCTVKGSGANYKTTATKQSNTEHAYFGSQNRGTSDDTIEYTLKNARHLYNIRYLEDYSDSQRLNYDGLQTAGKVTYLLDDDIDWNTFIDGGNLFAGQKIVRSDALDNKQEKSFASIKQLRENNEFKSNGQKAHKIAGLIMSDSANEYARVYAGANSNKNGTGKKKDDPSEDQEGSAGLFLVNSGTLENVILDEVNVSGENMVGAFCGVNTGKLIKLTVDNSNEMNPSEVTGKEYVGGITGYQKPSGTDINLSNLVNRAEVSGKSYVGGITGSLTTNDDKIDIVVKDCSNYGKLSVVLNDGEQAEDAKYIGGITGYVSVFKNGKKGSVTIQGCTSSPQYSNDDIRKIIGDENELQKHLRGVFVGGIVGYNSGGAIIECNTKKEDASKEGYIFGYNYVGGIVGYNAGGAGKGNASGAQIDGTVNRRAGINEVHVMGNSYVGGIVGCNAGFMNNGNKKQEPDVTPTEKYIIANWENRGIVVADSDFAGGISGFNAGIIENCTCNVENSDAVKSIVKSSSLHGDFVGGVAGYNSGWIKADKAVNVICYVAGNNYLGGIVGYNAPRAEVINCGVAGGYIIGEGSFVGGFAGLNASAKLLDNMSITANPNEVRGTFCVGGTLGANMAAVEKKSDGLIAYFKTDNFLGELKAKAFAGGFIGYNVLLTENGNVSGNLKNDKILNAAMEVADDFSDLIEENDGSPEDLEDLLEDAVDIVEDLAEDLKKENDNILQITSSLDSPDASHSKFGGLTAEIYVGGVIGYNEEHTKLRIENVTNLTPVKATSAIENEDEQEDRKEAENFVYSYAGGIIGKVTENVTLVNCKNQDVGDVTSQGTYLGGLCEINEGDILNCEVSSIGTIDKGYVGGIAGLNKEDGVIKGTVFRNRTVTGRDYVGGVAAENFGKITETVLSNANISAHSYVGGIAGFSAKGAEITIATLQDSENNKVNVTATGENIGGLVGFNAGKLSVAGGNEEGYVELTGSVTGGSNVGGIVGLSAAGDISSFINNATIIADNGDAGGIVGACTDNSQDTDDRRITKCKNNGNVTATRSGNAGGIIGNNNGLLSDCTNTAAITSPNGMCGGMAGLNTGTISNCEVYEDGTELTFISKTYGGGICGYNKGANAVIENCKVRGIELTNPADSTGDECALGGITGKNDGKVQLCSVGMADEASGGGFSLWSLFGSSDSDNAKVSLISHWAKVNMGGIAGINAGQITGNDNSYCKVNADLSFIQTNQAYYGNLGGIAGVNLDVISHCEFNGKIEGTSNNPQLSPEYNPNTDQETNGSVIYGYGGIAGVNGNSGAQSSASITACKVNAAKITGLGDPNNIVNIGGVAGVNGLGASISGITFGSEDKYQNESYNVYVGAGGNNSSYAHAGGVAGLNSGIISNIYTIADGNEGYTYDTAVDQTKVIVEGYLGHIGGIVGYNRRAGQINHVANGNQWKVTALQNAQDNGCGGIVGYQAFDNTMSYCMNRAAVSKVVSKSNGVGGIIGRMETATSSSFIITHCINYGEVHGTDRTGGIIGVWKYYGGTVSDCKNFGFITNDGSEGAGGIVGSFYSLNATPAIIVRCENHGSIRCSYSGGIVGTTSGASASITQIRNCVNTGLIQAGDNCGGIMGDMKKKLDKSSFIESCNNYGNGVNFSKTGEISASNDNLGGIVALNLSGVKISKCFGLASVNWPIAAKGITMSNYYLTESKTGAILKYYTADNQETDVKPDAFYVKKIETHAETGQISSESNLNKLVWERDDKDTQRAYFNVSNSTGPWTYTFTFNTSIELSGMDLLWNIENAKNPRRALFDVYYSKYTSDDFNGGDWQLYKQNIYSDSGQLSENEKISKTVLEGDKVFARRIRIVVKESKLGESDINLCLVRAYFKGTITLNNQNYEYDGSKGYWYSGDYQDYKIPPLTYASNSYNGLSYEEVSLNQDAAKGIGVAVNVLANNNGGFEMNFGGSVIIGLPGFSYNPLIDMVSEFVKTDSSLEALGDSENNTRYKIFMADNGYFNTEASTEVDELQSPQNLKHKDIGAATYRIQWDPVKNASFYEYTAIYYSKSGNKIAERSDIVYDTSVDLTVSRINGELVDKIEFSVKAGTITLVNNKPETKTSSQSNYELEVASVLPSPLYHFELDADSLQYKAYLDNYDEYVDFFLSDKGSMDLVQDSIQNLKIYIYPGKANDALIINAVDGVSDSGYAGDKDNNNIIFSAYAACKDYTSSEKLLRESQAPAGEVYTSGDKLAIVTLDPRVTDVGFMGTRLDALSYQLKINAVKNKVLYMRSEMMATVNNEKSLLNGIPISVSTSQLRTSDTTDTAVKTSLSALPEDLFLNYKDLQVRSYPMMMSNNIVYTGHTVDLSAIKEANKSFTGIGIDAKTLSELYVTENNGVASSGAESDRLIRDGKLAPGFVIELATDNTYTLYYNALLAYNDTQVEDPYPSTGTMTNQVFYHSLPEECNMAETPKISTNASTDGYVNEDSLDITWDKDKFKNGAVYDYVITGSQADGSSAQIAAGVFTSESGKENYLSYDTSSWNYKTVNITISRRGEVDKNGMTILFPSTNTVICKFRSRFTQLTRPDVYLHKYEDGSVEKNSLLYDVTWKNLPENERLPEGEDQTSELDSYKITVKPSSENGITQTFDNNETYQDMLERMNTLYASKADKQEAGSNSSRYEWQMAGEGYTVVKVMLLTWDDEALTITRLLTEEWKFVADDVMRGADTLTKVLDLNDYGRGDRIAISVQAIAASDAKDYRNSMDGVIREVTLPERLGVPDVSNLYIDPKYQEDTFMTLENYQAGINLIFNLDEGSGELQGRYELAIAVYDSPTGPDTSKVANAGDGDTEGYWNYGAIETITTKSKASTMSGNLLNASGVLKLKDKYAGKWLKIAVRSISESNVSSLWSDEDESTDKTINYAWLQIPRLQLTVPEIGQGTKTLYYNEEGYWNRVPDEIGNSNEMDITQTSFNISAVDNADRYQLQLIRSGVDDKELGTIRYVDWVYLEGTEGGYNVFYMTSDPEWQYNVSDTDPVCSQNSLAVWQGKLSDGQFVQLPYTGEVADSDMLNAGTYTVVSYVQMNDDGSGFTLVIPDTLAVKNYTDPAYLFTSQLSVQAKSSENLRFADSKVNDWYRVDTNRSHIVTLDDYIDAPVVTLKLKASERPGTAYELMTENSDHWMVYEVSIYEGDALLKQTYISTYGNGTPGAAVDTTALLSNDDFAAYQGKRISVRCAAIIGGEQNGSLVRGGLSQWSEPINLGNLPELILTVPEVQTKASTMAADLNGTGSFSETIPAVVYTWDKSDKASGYEIKINGETFSIVCDENLAEGSRKLTEISAASETPQVQNTVPETYDASEPETVPATETQAPQEITSIPQDETTDPTDATQQTETQPITEQTDPVASISPKGVILSLMPVQQTDASITYRLSADVTLTVTRDGEKISFSLIMPEKVVQLGDITYNFTKEGTNYIEIIPIPECEEYSSLNGYIVP